MISPRHHHGLLLLLLGTSACSEDDGISVPLPDEFEAAFVAGQVCMPSNVQTGTTESSGAPEYPIRFDTCVYRCVAIDRTTARVYTSWICAAGQCELSILSLAHATTIKTEADCDARDLVNPPAGECTPQSFEFSLAPPCCLDNPDTGAREYVTGDVRVSIPFLDQEQTDEISARVDQGEPLASVVQDVVGPQNTAGRQWVVNFDPGHPAVSSAANLGGGDCHQIAPP